VQAWDRYAYSNNNPLRYTDPTGHTISCGAGEAGACGGDTAEYRLWQLRHYYLNCQNRTGQNCPNVKGIITFTVLSLVVAGAGGPAIDTAGGAVEAGVQGLAAACLANPLCAALVFGITKTISFPDNPSQLGHIFRNAPGHLTEDTVENRNLILETVSKIYYIMTDKFGNELYSRLLADGTEVWVLVRNGIIQNGGVNVIPKYH
jgi:hypothetical protein